MAGDRRQEGDPRAAARLSARFAVAGAHFAALTPAPPRRALGPPTALNVLNSLYTEAQRGAVFRAAIKERNSADSSGADAPFCASYSEAQRGAVFRAAIKERNSADSSGADAPFCASYTEAKRGAVFRAAIKERNSADSSGADAPFCASYSEGRKEKESYGGICARRCHRLWNDEEGTAKAGR
jgi:hypothetical protein